MHEPLIKLARWQDIGTLFAGQNGYSHVGISDHAMSFHLGEIMDLLPAAQVLIVLRADYEVAESLARINPGPPPVPYIELIRRRLSGIEASDRVKIVQFMDLGAAGMVYECLDHLMPGAEIDQRKIATMQALNTQARMDLSRQRAERALRQGRVPGILGHDVVAELQKTA
jgi:hypothetical protein